MKECACATIREDEIGKKEETEREKARFLIMSEINVDTQTIICVFIQKYQREIPQLSPLECLHWKIVRLTVHETFEAL